MRFAAATTEKAIRPSPLPAWARPAHAYFEQGDSGLFAGAALAALDAIIRSEPVFAGVWRNRLALRAAAATVRMTGRPEDEDALRDARFLRSKGDALGPVGEHLQAWRALVANSTLSLEALKRAGRSFGLGPSAPLP